MRLTISADGSIEKLGNEAEPYPLYLQGALREARLDSDRGEQVLRPSPSGETCIEAHQIASTGRRLRLWLTSADEPITVHLPLPQPSPPDFVRLSWDLPSDERRLLAVKLMPLDSGTGLHSQVVLSRQVDVASTLLERGRSYRLLLREFDGRNFTRRVGELSFEHSATATTQLHDVARCVERFFTGLKQSSAPAGDLGALTSSDDTEALRSVLAKHLFDAMPEEWARPGQLDFSKLRPSLARIADKQTSRYARETLRYLEHYAKISGVFAEYATASKRSLDSVYRGELGLAVRECVEKSPSFSSDSVSSNLLLAMATSLTDRERAAEYFARARSLDSAWFDALLLDEGASTYFSDVELNAAAATNDTRRAECHAVHELLESGPKPDPRLTLLCSCDVAFFRAHSPYWFNVAPVLAARGLAVHFVLLGERRATHEAVEAGRDLGRTVAALRRTSAPPFSYSISSVPGFVSDPRTFYACARYLLARRVAARLGTPILISDIDLALRDDPASFVGLLQLDKLGVQPGSGLYNLSPWRRCTAGTFLLPVSGEQHQFLELAERYMVHGLGPARDGRPRRWMLDQNALAYMLEKVVLAGRSDLLQDLSQLERPSKRDPIMSALEELQSSGPDRSK